MMRYWKKFWFEADHLSGLKTLRFLFGIYLFLYLFHYLPHVSLMFSDQGVYTPYNLIPMALPVVAAWSLFIFTLCVFLMFAIGRAVCVTGPLSFGLFMYYYLLNLWIKNTSFDRLNIIIMVLLVVGILAIQFSKKPHYLASACFRLLQIQLYLVYFGAGYWKFINVGWQDSEILYWTLLGPWGTELSFALIHLNLPMVFYSAVAWLVIIYEMVLSIGLWIPRVKYYVMLLGLMFHLSNWVLLGIPEFMNCVLLYVLFICPRQVEHYYTLVASRFIPKPYLDVKAGLKKQ